MTRKPLLIASIVAEAMTPLIPGAGPPPTRIANVSLFTTLLHRGWHLGDDRIAEDSDLFDLELDDVAVFEEERRLTLESDAFGRSGCNDIAGFERHEVAEKRDDLRAGKDHVRCIGILHDSPVEPRLDRQLLRIADLRRRNERGSERRERVDRFAGAPLACLHLQIARANIVHDRVAGDVIERLGFGHILAALADDDR